MKKTYLAATTGVALAVMLILAAPQAPAARQNGKGRRIEGTWLVEVTERNCQNGSAIATATIPALNTFLAGGSMLSNPALPPAALRTGHGVWEHAGGRSFTNTVVFFRFNPPNGAYAGTLTLRRDIELGENSDQFTSTDRAESADPSGNVLEIRCATTAGRRLE
jgi:hypothetical protein